VLTPAFKWVNTALGNTKTAIRAIRQKHIPRYLAKFAYRFNRTLRSRRHDAPPRPGRRAKPANALPPPQTG
jgi:hypothetical protein